MSSMLEQAILDAKELKEAAIRNAQQALIEKYSGEFENEIEKLLEQVDPAAPAATAPVDPALTAGAPVAGVPAMPGMATAGLSPVDPEKAKADTDNKSSIFDKLNFAFKDGEVIEDKIYPTGVVEIPGEVIGPVAVVVVVVVVPTPVDSVDPTSAKFV